MTVNPGFGGQHFIRTTLPNRASSGGRHPGRPATWRSTVASTTAPLAVEAEANVLVAGSAIFGHPEGVGAAMKHLWHGR
jgi:ribulose-phosphate 3-epimerase